MSALHPALSALIADLAEMIVDDYLRGEAAANQVAAGECSKPVPLPGFEQAA